MKLPFLLCSMLLILSFPARAQSAETYAGTWRIEPSQRPNSVALTLTYRRHNAGGNDQWEESNDFPFSQLRGLSPGDLDSSGEHKRFTIAGDAGEFDADGWFAHRQGSGTWTFVPNASLGDELQRRGIGRPSERQQFELAIGGFRLSTLDALRNAGFQTPNIDDLVRMKALKII